MTVEDQLADSLFRAGMSLVRSAVKHAGEPEADVSLTQFFYRELNQECRKLVPEPPLRTQKGTQLGCDA
jgi:hypothetical protein